MISTREHKPAAPVSIGNHMHEKNKNAEIIKEADPEKKKKKEGEGNEMMGQTSVGQTKQVPSASAALDNKDENISVKGILTALDNFPGRSKEKFGVGEKINLDIAPEGTDLKYIEKPFPLTYKMFDVKYDKIPAPKGFDPEGDYKKAAAAHDAQEYANKHPATSTLGGFQWEAVGGGKLAADPKNTGKTVYTAPETGAAVTLNLKSVKSGKIVFSKSIQVVAPDHLNVKRNTVQAPQLWHLAKHVSAGFAADFYLTPNNVSFSAVLFEEGVCGATVTGTGGFAAHDHDPGTAGPFPVSMPANSTDGSKAGLLDRAQMLYAAALSKNTGGKTIAHSTFKWMIPGLYKVGPKGKVHTFTHTEQFAEGYTTGKMDVSKGGSGKFSRELNDPEVNSAPYIIYPPLP